MNLPKDWQIKDNQLFRELKTKNFVESVELIKKITIEAETMNHHPDIEFGWGYLRIYLMTHSKGEITDLDYSLARKLNSFL